MQGPFNGKFLRVNLTNGTTTPEEVPDLTYRMYLGGAPWRPICSIGSSRQVWTHWGLTMSWYSPPALRMERPSRGQPAQAAKSPLTGGYGEAEAGGLGAGLKLAGFDAVIVTGQSSKPVYLWIADSRAELRDAAPVGQDLGDVQDRLKEETDRRARVLPCRDRRGEWGALRQYRE